MTEDERQQAALFLAIFNRVAADYTIAVLLMTKHKKIHGTLPFDTIEVFTHLKNRMVRVLAEMKQLRIKVEGTTPIDQLIVPDYLPEEL